MQQRRCRRPNRKHSMELRTDNCPRCEVLLTTEEFYGLCQACAGELRTTFDGTARTDVAAVDYEPKMNVTPNAVASKE